MVSGGREVTRVIVVTVAGPGVDRTAANLRRQTHPNLDHRIVQRLGDGFADASGAYGVIIAAGSTITRRFLADAAAVLDRDPTVGLVAPGRPTANGAPAFDLGAQLIRDGLPPATMFRVDAVQFDEAVGAGVLWDAWLGVLASGSAVRVLPRHAQRNAPPAPELDDAGLQLIMTRHFDLYTREAEAFWRAILEQRTRLMALKMRYGRTEDALHWVADRVRRKR